MTDQTAPFLLPGSATETQTAAPAPSGANRWPNVAANPALANDIAHIVSEATNGHALFSVRYGIAEALLAAGWRPTTSEES